MMRKVGGALAIAWLLGIPRLLGQVGAIGAIAAYVLAVGAQPSVIRAGVSGALVSLALHGDGVGPTSVRDVAERTGLPQPYLEQILLALKGAGLVRSKRGVGGGYVLAREPASITLGSIVSAVDSTVPVATAAPPTVSVK